MCSASRTTAGVKSCASHAIPLTFVEDASTNSARKPVHYDARASSKIVSLGIDAELVGGDLDEDGAVAASMHSLVTACVRSVLLLRIRCCFCASAAAHRISSTVIILCCPPMTTACPSPPHRVQATSTCCDATASSL